MSTKIQIRQGLLADLPVLDIGEFGFATDTEELYIGTASGNILAGGGGGGAVEEGTPETIVRIGKIGVPDYIHIYNWIKCSDVLSPFAAMNAAGSWDDIDAVSLNSVLFRKAGQGGIEFGYRMADIIVLTTYLGLRSTLNRDGWTGYETSDAWQDVEKGIKINMFSTSDYERIEQLGEITKLFMWIVDDYDSPVVNPKIWRWDKDSSETLLEFLSRTDTISSSGFIGDVFVGFAFDVEKIR